MGPLWGFVEVCSTKGTTNLRSDLKSPHSPWHRFYLAFVFLIEDAIAESKGG